MALSSGILESYLRNAFRANQELRPEDLLKYSREMKGGEFLTPLSFYLDILENTDEVMVPYLSLEQKNQLRHDLQIAHLLLCAQKHYEFTHQKIENEKKYIQHLKHCSLLLDALNPIRHAIIEKAPEQACFADGMLTKYCGIGLAKEFAEQLDGLASQKSKTLKEALDKLNEKRLYWIWGSVLLKTVLTLVPNDFFNSKQARDTITAPDPYTGCLSWTLYYFRGSLSLFLLMKHTIQGPWMQHQEERETPWQERFQTQWAQRKFTLLNDFIWGTANLLCFFWLTGKGVLGTYGDALTVMLLMFDISMVLWDFVEQQTEYNKKILQFDKDIAGIKELHHDVMHLQLNALMRAKAKCQREWTLKQLNLYNNIGYALALMVSFVLLTTPFIAVSAVTLLPLGIAGAVLCFAFTVLSAAIKGGGEIHKSRKSLKDARHRFQEYVAVLKKMLQNPKSQENEKIFLYLEIKKLHAETEYQKQVLMFQTIHLVRAIFIEALVPAFIFVSLVFLPLGIGLAVLGGALGLAIATNLLIHAFFTPDEGMKKLPPLDQAEYNDFCDLITKKESCQTAEHKFFKSKNKAKVPQDQEIICASDSSPPSDCAAL